MSKESGWLTKDEKHLCDEILRVTKALELKKLALNGSQYRMFQRLSKRMQYREEYASKLDGIELYSTETRKRHKKSDMVDAFGEPK